MNDLIGKPQGQRSKFCTGDPKRSRGPYDTGEPSSPIADAKDRSRFATGQARYMVEHEILKKQGRDKGRNVRIKPEDLLGRRFT